MLAVRGFLGDVRAGEALHGVAHTLHEPAWCRGGATDADVLLAREPRRVDVGLVADEMSVGVGIQALGKQDG